MLVTVSKKWQISWEYLGQLMQESKQIQIGRRCFKLAGFVSFLVEATNAFFSTKTIVKLTFLMAAWRNG